MPVWLRLDRGCCGMAQRGTRLRTQVPRCGKGDLFGADLHTFRSYHVIIIWTLIANSISNSFDLLLRSTNVRVAP